MSTKIRKRHEVKKCKSTTERGLQGDKLKNLIFVIFEDN